MYATLDALAQLVATPPGEAKAATVVAACDYVRDLLGAEDAYIIRSGDPAFVRIGSNDDPTAYEIKQRGYWIAWRDSAVNPSAPIRLLTVSNRLVEEIVPLAADVPATHVAAILPGDESNSELLIVRGPWAEGLSGEQVQLLNLIRPLLAYLASSVLDGQRQNRLQNQMRALADIAEAFSQSDQSENPLSALATALARASGFAWVTIKLIDPAMERVLDSAMNQARHSNTRTAALPMTDGMLAASLERDLRIARHLARVREPYCLPDVNEPKQNLLVDDEVRWYYERAHIISTAAFPVFVRDRMLGTISFSASEQHAFEGTEREFLSSLVSHAGPTINAISLNRDLRQAQHRLETILTHAPVIITVFEPDGTIMLVDGAGLGQVGAQMESLVGTKVYDAVPEKYREVLKSSIERTLAGELFETDLQVAGRDLQTRYAPLKDDAGKPTGVIGVTVDVSEQNRAERELRRVNAELQQSKEKAEYLARHDALTGLLSRRAWFEAASRGPSTAIAVIDIDRFKSVNDRFGHPSGDSVLRAVAERLMDTLGDRCILGRLGGEEFGLLFSCPMPEAEQLCEGAVQAVGGSPCLLSDGAPVSVTVSAGLAPCRRASDNAEEAVARAYDLADRALYAAKEAGRHRLVVTPHAA